MKAINTGLVLLGLGSLMFLSCEEEALEAAMPTMEHRETALVMYPTTEDIVAYWCPDLLGAFLCDPLLGPAPAEEDMEFTFGLTFEVNNPNDLPIPTLSMLLAIDVFAGQEVQELGAVCVTFCESGSDSCNATSATDACQSDGQEGIQSWEDLAVNAAVGLVTLATSDEIGGPYEGNEEMKMIPAQGSLDLKVVFTLGIDAMMDIIYSIIEDILNDWIDGTETALVIPYAVSGTVWFELPYNFGRFGLTFGPLEDAWEL